VQSKPFTEIERLRHDLRLVLYSGVIVALAVVLYSGLLYPVLYASADASSKENIALARFLITLFSSTALFFPLLDGFKRLRIYLLATEGSNLEKVSSLFNEMVLFLLLVQMMMYLFDHIEITVTFLAVVLIIFYESGFWRGLRSEP
jgi:hypothetical protein